MNKLLRVWNKDFCAGAEFDEKTGIIKKAAPILKKFRGQHISHLIKWAHNKGMLTCESVCLQKRSVRSSK